MTVLRKSRELKSHTEPRRLRPDPHEILMGLWVIITLSLALDPWIIAYHPVDNSHTGLGYGAVIVAHATIPFLDRRRAPALISRLRRINKNESERKSRIVSFILVTSVLFTLVVKVLLLPHIDNLMALVFVGCIVFGSIKHIRHTLAHRNTISDTLKTEPAQYIKQWESQLVTLSVIPIVLARSISALATISNTSSDDLFFRIAAVLTSFVFLLILRPTSEVFTGFCAKCRNPTPIVYVEYGSCPRCDESLKKEPRQA